MVKVKSVAECQKNYEDSTAYVPTRFEQGVNSATWNGEAQAGQALYEAQMTRAEILHRRLTGISKISDAQWRQDTITKGKAVIGTRMKAASGKQQTNWAPYRSAIESVTLPAKVTDPMQNLMNRAGAIVKALTDTKASQG